MIYDLEKDYDRQLFVSYCKKLLDKSKDKNVKVELKERRAKRSIRQNSYLHLLLAMVAMKLGDTLENVKYRYYKINSNPTLFLIQKPDKITGEVYEDVRSSATLNSKEMSLSIDNFKDYVYQHTGLKLPDAEDKLYLAEIEKNWEREKHYQKLYLVNDINNG